MPNATTGWSRQFAPYRLVGLPLQTSQVFKTQPPAHPNPANRLELFWILQRRLIVRHDLCAEALEPAGIRS